VVELENRVLEELRRIARVELEYPQEVLLTQRLQEDLRLDSMAMIVVAVGLENAFRVKLQEEDAGAIATVADLVKLVVRRVGEAKSETL
jgi:acyl carrier protein